jgi:hypothetical protein
MNSVRFIIVHAVCIIRLIIVYAVLIVSDLSWCTLYAWCQIYYGVRCMQCVRFPSYFNHFGRIEICVCPISKVFDFLESFVSYRPMFADFFFRIFSNHFRLIGNCIFAILHVVGWL